MGYKTVKLYSSNLSFFQLKIDFYIHRMLYVNLTVTTHTKIYIVNTQKKMKKEFNHYTKESHQTTREDRMTGVKQFYYCLS